MYLLDKKERKMRMVKIKPTNKRLKQLITEFGEDWEIIETRQSVQCFDNAGLLIQSKNKKHHRWVKYSDCLEFFVQN